MAHIIMIDDSVPFVPATLQQRPLGGAETAFIRLAEALAKQGHQVTACHQGGEKNILNGVSWQAVPKKPLATKPDLYIANRQPRLLSCVPGASKSLLWLHNPAQYLRKWRHTKYLLRHLPHMVFTGPHHLNTLPWWLPRSRTSIVPLGIDPDILAVPTSNEVPPPRAIFTSNPLRSLEWLLEIWQKKIHPNVPEAELWLFCGAEVYSGIPEKHRLGMQRVLELARASEPYGVKLKRPVARAELAQQLIESRVMLYRGDPGETFCLSLAEAQACGLPAVVQPIGCVAERIKDGKTGNVVRDDEAFAAAAVRLLRNDTVWLEMHESCLKLQRDLTWDKVATQFVNLMN